jgi:sulfite reductase (NADPH) flavoprotein alpha-component
MFGRDNPFPARIVDKRWLTAPGTDRPTLHVALSIGGSGFDVQPGDTVNLVVHNEPALVDAVANRLDLGDDAKPALRERLSLGMPSLKLLRAISERLDDDDAAIALEDLCDDDAALDAYLRERDLLDVLAEHPFVAFEPDELGRLLPSLQPRTYSVASSTKRHPGEVHLTVGIVRWSRGDRTRTGVASAHLERSKVGDMVPLFWQPSAHFRLPDDRKARLLCIGPGTGVAPFRGFLHEHEGPVWLFFGARTRAHDFYYRDELEALASPHRVDLAFSRDQPDRVYVQHRLKERAAELREFIDAGTHVYLCGDASSMAPAVEATLNEILDGGLEPLKRSKRYHRDVY